MYSRGDGGKTFRFWFGCPQIEKLVPQKVRPSESSPLNEKSSLNGSSSLRSNTRYVPPLPPPFFHLPPIIDPP